MFGYLGPEDALRMLLRFFTASGSPTLRSPLGATSFAFLLAPPRPAEGLCAGPGIPATRRLSGHLWRAPGTGAARGQGPGLGSGRRVR